MQNEFRYISITRLVGISFLVLAVSMSVSVRAKVVQAKVTSGVRATDSAAHQVDVSSPSIEALVNGSSQTGTVSELGALQQAQIVAEARLKLQKTNDQLAQGRISGRSASSTLLPAIKMIGGPSNNLTAKLVYPGGSEADAVEGRQIPGGYHVTKVTIDEVHITDSDGVNYVLATSGTSTTSSVSHAAHSGPGGQMMAPSPINFPINSGLAK